MSNCEKQCFNPYLPNYEYVPDGEPHVFDGRIYVYGSHDLFNGKGFCLGDYVCWSCPDDDVKDWRYEGVIWRRSDDPENKNGKMPMYAPDVCRGYDGRYYLYYFVSKKGIIGVAVCDTPAGKYEFYGYVRHPDGTVYGRRKGDLFQFDPGVFAENGKVYLYTGFAPVFPFFGAKKYADKGPVCAVWKDDMITVESVRLIGVESRKSGKGTPYEGHEFFEASSVRKIGGRYYFIYSSFLGHELCYAVSDNPLGKFRFGGTIVSIGDVGLRGIKGIRDASNFTGNTHGSIVCDKDGRYYIFYHRHTNRHCFSRQACAEPIIIESDGSIKQVETTSQGLNGRPLTGNGEYSASIACNLTCKKGGAFYLMFKRKGRPYFTQTGKDRNDSPDQYIADVSDGTTVGFKYFSFDGATAVSVKITGRAEGEFTVTDGEKTVARIPVNGCGTFTAPLNVTDGVHPLFFSYNGRGKCDLKSIILGQFC